MRPQTTIGILAGHRSHQPRHVSGAPGPHTQRGPVCCSGNVQHHSHASHSAPARRRQQPVSLRPPEPGTRHARALPGGDCRAAAVTRAKFALRTGNEGSIRFARSNPKPQVSDSMRAGIIQDQEALWPRACPLRGRWRTLIMPIGGREGLSQSSGDRRIALTETRAGRSAGTGNRVAHPAHQLAQAGSGGRHRVRCIENIMQVQSRPARPAHRASGHGGD